MHPDCVKPLYSLSNGGPHLSPAALWADMSGVSWTLLSSGPHKGKKRDILKCPVSICKEKPIRTAAAAAIEPAITSETEHQPQYRKEAQEKKAKCAELMHVCVCFVHLCDDFSPPGSYTTHQFSPAYWCKSQTGVCLQLSPEARTPGLYISSWEFNRLFCVMSGVIHLSE